MDMRILGGLGAAGLLALFVAHGNGVTAEEHEKLVAKYELTTPQEAFMSACKSNMSHHNVEFTQAGNTASGCACLASEMSVPRRSEPLAHYKLASDAYEALIKSRKSVDQGAKMVEFSQAIASANDVSLGDVLKITTDILDATQTCGVRTQAAIKDARIEKESSSCANMTDAQHDRMESILAKSGKGYDRKTCKQIRPGS